MSRKSRPARFAPQAALQQPVGRATPSVSGLYADALTGFLRQRGYAQRNADKPSGPVDRVGGHTYAQTLLDGARELGDRALGLAFGRRIGGAGFGLLGIAAATAPTLGASIARLVRLEALTSTLGRAEMRRDGPLVHLQWRPVQNVPNAVIEGILAGWVSFARYFLGEAVEVHEVAFAHRRSAAPVDYDEVFACPQRFDTPLPRLTVRAELLDARPRFADATVAHAFDGWIDHCANAVTSSNRPCTQRIATLLGSDVALAEVDECLLAARLGLSRRSLQRRLREEGTSFRQLIEAARAQHAIVELLRGERRLTDLGAEVGYDEQASLCRAFRKWTGYSPLAFKERHAALFTPRLPGA